MQLLTVLREFRGSAHLIAIRASGLDAKTAHFIRRPNDIGMFGWNDADAPAITEVEVARLADADELTDRLVLPAYSVLDEAGAGHRHPSPPLSRSGNASSSPHEQRTAKRNARPSNAMLSPKKPGASSGLIAKRPLPA